MSGLPSTIYIFGAFPRGHRLYTADGREEAGRVPYLVWRGCDPFDVTPSARQIEGHRTPRTSPAGWSFVSWWDRQGDPRYGSHTGVLARGNWSAEALLAACRRDAPWAIRVAVSSGDWR